MRVPSYDDLTPPIEDVSVRDTFAAAVALCASAPPASALRATAGKFSRSEERGASSGLYACLRSPRAPQAIISIARDFSPRIERHGPSCVVFDVGGLGRLLGDAQAIGGELERAAIVSGGNINVAVASTQTAAMLLAIGRPGLSVADGDPAAAVAALPVTTLSACELFSTRVGPSASARLDPIRASARPRRSLGEGGHPHAAARSGRGRRSVCDVHLETFERWGLHTLGDVAALPPADLSQRMGQPGVWLQRVACGLDLRPLVPDPDVPRFTASLELEWPIDALEPLSFVLARLLDPLSAALERADRAAAAMRLDLRLVDRTSHTRTLLLPAAMRDPRVLRTLLLLDLESHPPQAAIDIVGVELDPAPSRIVQYSLLERAVPTPEAIATLTARLNALVGDTRCGSPVLMDTHRPDSFEMRSYAAIVTGSGLRDPLLAPRSSTETGGKSEPRPVDHPTHRQAQGRPDPSTGSGSPRAESRGEDGRGPTDPEAFRPSSSGEMREARSDARASHPLRRFRPPVAIRVVIERGRPIRVHVDRRGMPGGRVEQAAGPWRASGGWWNAETAMYWDRDEWDVSFADGTVCRIFRDRIAGTWFMEGVLD